MINELLSDYGQLLDEIFALSISFLTLFVAPFYVKGYLIIF